MKYVVCMFGVHDYCDAPRRVYGPFDSESEAKMWGECNDHAFDCDWVVLPLELPVDFPPDVSVRSI